LADPQSREQFQFEAILEAIKEQGASTARSLDRLGVEIKGLVERVVDGRSMRPTNGLSAFAAPAFLLSVIVFAVTLLGQSQGSTRTEIMDKVKGVSGDAKEAVALAGENGGTLISHDERLKEIETQFSWMSDVANLERQHMLILVEFVRQCPKCKIPARDYWPLEIGRRGRANGQ
jgi:hypothetical protein